MRACRWGGRSDGGSRRDGRAPQTCVGASPPVPLRPGLRLAVPGPRDRDPVVRGAGDHDGQERPGRRPGRGIGRLHPARHQPEHERRRGARVQRHVPRRPPRRRDVRRRQHVTGRLRRAAGDHRPRHRPADADLEQRRRHRARVRHHADVQCHALGRRLPGRVGRDQQRRRLQQLRPAEGAEVHQHGRAGAPQLHRDRLRPRQHPGERAAAPEVRAQSRGRAPEGCARPHHRLHADRHQQPRRRHLRGGRRRPDPRGPGVPRLRRRRQLDDGPRVPRRTVAGRHTQRPELPHTGLGQHRDQPCGRPGRRLHTGRVDPGRPRARPGGDDQVRRRHPAAGQHHDVDRGTLRPRPASARRRTSTTTPARPPARRRPSRATPTTRRSR